MSDINHENLRTEWIFESMAEWILDIYTDQEAGLSLKELLAVELIGARGFIRMTDLAGIMSLPLTTISSMVDRLTGRQLLKRSRFEDERRIVAVSLTPEGQAAWERLKARQNSWINERLGLLSTDDRIRLVELLDKVSGK